MVSYHKKMVARIRDKLSQNSKREQYDLTAVGSFVGAEPTGFFVGALSQQFENP